MESRAMASLYNVHCMLCGRHAGQVQNGSFRRLPSAPPLTVRAGKSRCGYCSGSLYLEAEDSAFGRDMASYARVSARDQAKRAS
jgi:hypothetical protein